MYTTKSTTKLAIKTHLTYSTTLINQTTVNYSISFRQQTQESEPASTESLSDITPEQKFVAASEDGLEKVLLKYAIVPV